MSVLQRHAQNLLTSVDTAEENNAVSAFLETVTFASHSDIAALLHDHLPSVLPDWAINISRRLANLSDIDSSPADTAGKEVLSTGVEELISAAQWVIGAPKSETMRARARFVNLLSTADAEVIVTMLNHEFEKDWMALPVWARNLSFRLACLQKPNDADLLRQAGADLLCFGPDWDSIANDLLDRARFLAGNA
ncbi:hypothetical protein ACFXK0_10680 [Nocardia sp. NPDC059177]|uniref:hypothetical protein n=1 Tax=Nocardia sp. NPDC059177 TaxID=3346759 RepID=UPI0036CC16AC